MASKPENLRFVIPNPLDARFYDGWQGVNTEYLEYSFRAVFIVSSPSAPPDGELVGDILYVRAPDGYRNIVHKVKHMMGLVSEGGCKSLHIIKPL